QECLSQQQALGAVRQMQKLLAAQEAAQLRGTRGLRHQLSVLQSRLQRQATRHNETCPPPAVPPHGRVLGRNLRVGHDVHFVCEAGFRLVGSETRGCRQDGTWSGTQPFCRSIDDCSSNPCANSGTCVDGNQSYTCLCLQGWAGPSCQNPVHACSNASFSRQPRCAEGRPGTRRCTCDPGFQLRAGGVCHDVDECRLFQSSPQTQLCLYDCLNLPGSYRCLCPPGYLLRADRNTCEDVNECTGKQHNCTQGDLCINTFGGHRCVRPKCPPPRHNTSYVKTSTFQCERNPCPMESRACRLAATSISFHYLPLQANRTVPHVLFKMSTTRFVGDSLRFAITGGRRQGVFTVRRSNRQTGELVLTSPVAGPATLEVELEMSEFSRKVLLGKHIFKVTAFVSPYEF
ncbi:FBLN7 protein, partial [Aegotheles bennettii]|nr:FBLN7 protein [Aegotheles bennettii]